MASSAVLRLACRALSRLPSSIPHALAAEGRPAVPAHVTNSMPTKIIGPRRLYSTELNPKYSALDPPATHQNSGPQLSKKISEERVSTKLDTISSNYKEIGNTYKQIIVALREKKKRERRRRQVFVGGSILTGLAIYFKAPFFRRSEEAEDERWG